MSPKDIVRAWKNEEYFKTLSVSEAAATPANPAGDIKLCSHSGSFLPTIPPSVRCPSGAIPCTASDVCFP